MIAFCLCLLVYFEKISLACVTLTKFSVFIHFSFASKSNFKNVINRQSLTPSVSMWCFLLEACMINKISKERKSVSCRLFVYHWRVVINEQGVARQTTMWIVYITTKKISSISTQRLDNEKNNGKKCIPQTPCFALFALFVSLLIFRI